MVKNITLIEKQIKSSDYKSTISPIFSPGNYKSCCFIVKDDTITIKTIYDLIASLFRAIHTLNVKEALIFFVGHRFDEKLTYILLECYLEHVIVDHNVSVRIHLENRDNIFTHGMTECPLQKLCSDFPDQDKVYSQAFRFDIGNAHYRKLFSPKDGAGENLSAALTSVCYIFKELGIPSEQGNSIADVAVELVGNALEHTQSECYLDIDIADNYVRKDKPLGKKYYGANLCVVNFSPSLLFSAIQNKLCINREIDVNEKASRYQMLRSIYAHQRRFFSSSYGDGEFFMLSTFQHKISGRPNEYETGGAGLPMLIKSLEQQSETNNCYVISGRHKMRFIQGLLEYDENQWIGMNKEKDFAHFIPDRRVFSRLPLNFPGTAYNLNFVIPKES